jgi:hypothetical protein
MRLLALERSMELIGEAARRVSRFFREKHPEIPWREMIRDHIAANLRIEADNFELSPFAQEGGIGRVHQLLRPGPAAGSGRHQ